MVKREERKRERRWQTEQFFFGSGSRRWCVSVCVFVYVKSTEKVID